MSLKLHVSTVGHNALVSLVLVTLLLFARFASASDAAQCELVGEEPGTERVPDIRPFQTWRCSYSEEQARRRIVRFFDSRHQSLRVEDVGPLFGITDMRADFDSARVATYTNELSGGGWSMRLSVIEGANSTDTGPAKFAPGPHPHRLDRFEDSGRAVDITFKLASAAGRTVEDCNRIFSYVAAATQAGWKNDPPLQPPADGARSNSTLKDESGRHFSIIPPNGPQCRVEMRWAEFPEGWPRP